MRAKKNLEFEQMSTVDLAAAYADRLIENEAAVAGSTDQAMRRIEARYGVGYWALWGLRYKRPKSVTADIFLQIRNAYLASCERQLASVAHNIAMERAKRGDDDLDADILAEAEALVAKIKAKRAVT